MARVSEICDCAESGDAFFQALLGFLFQHGHMGDVDKEAARQWYERAAQQDFPAGQFLLYELLWEEGKHEEAIPWLKKAAESGSLAAQASLGSYYWRRDHTDTDDERAFQWMKSAADQGFLPAIANLALMIEGGVHVEPDPAKAITYLRMGAERGYASCASMLGQRLLDEGASDSDIAEGLKWIREAAKKGDPFANSSLAQIYRFGLYGAKQDEELARIFDECAQTALRSK